MSDHLSTETIERFRRRELPTAELFTAGDHIAECEIGRERFGGTGEAAITLLQRNLRVVADGEPSHPADWVFAAYLRGRSDEVEREIIESHLEDCGQCVAVASDYRAVARHQPEAARGSGFRDWWRAPGLIRPWHVAAATIAASLLFAWVATLPLRREVDRLQAQLGPLRQANEDLRGEIAALGRLPSAPTETPAEVRLTINDGGRAVTLDRAGKISGLPPLAPADEQLVRLALLEGQVERPRLPAELAVKSGPLLGGGTPDQTFALLGPVGVVVITPQPTFRWRPLAGAASYTVKVYDAGLNTVAQSGPLTGTTWMPGRALARGGIYGWQVTAAKGGTEVTVPAPPAPEAKFQVLAPGPAEELARARQTYAGSHLILGLLYARSGLREEAEREFRALAEANPDLPAARKLLQNIRERTTRP